MAPTSDDVPYTRPAGPSRTSIRSISLSSTGKSATLWPVCGSQMFIPFRRIVIWSNVPPRILMSVCTPMSPRCRTSTPAAYFNKSLILCTGAAAIASRSSTVTIRAAWLTVSGTRLPVTSTSSSSYSFSPALFFSAVWADIPETGADASIATVITPILTGDFNVENTAYERLE